jgi:hypothetical protein
MNIQKFVRFFSEIPDQLNPKRNLARIMSVGNVNMKTVYPFLFRGCEIPGYMGVVSR